MSMQVRILLIDANAAHRQALVDMMRAAHHWVMDVATGAEGLRLIDEVKPDLILVEAALPDEDVLELCRQLREQAEPRRRLSSYVMLFSAAGRAPQCDMHSECHVDSVIDDPLFNDAALKYVLALAQVREAQQDLYAAHNVITAAPLKLPERVEETVLVVDDDARILQTFSRMLTLYGYQVLSAAGGREAVELYRREHPDIVLTDVRMPDLDGFGVLEAIHAENASAEVIFVTGHGDMQMTIEALRAGASDFIPKPINRNNLEAALRRARERLYMKRSLWAARQALQTSERHYRELFEGVPIGLFRTRASGEVLDVNPALVKMLGYPSREALLATRAIEWYADPADRQVGLAQLQALGEIHGHEVRWQRWDGAIIWARLAGKLVYDAEGGICYEGSAEDITSYKTVEQERERLLAQIQAQAEHLRQVVHSAPEGMVLLDNERRIVLTNTRARDDLDVLTAGAREGEVLDTLGGEAVARLLSLPSSGRYHEIVWKRNTYEVSAHTIEQSSAAERPGVNGWVLVLRDVTRQRRVEQRVQEQYRLAAVGQLAAGIAHDFNNVMSIVMMYAQMALRSETLAEAERKRLTIIYQQTQRAAKLIRQILDFSRRSVLERHPLDLLPLLKEQVQLFRRTLPETINVELIDDGGAYTVYADATRIQQVLLNLAFNARDAMPLGGTLLFRLDRLALVAGAIPPLPEIQPGAWIRLTISDTGVGMAPDVLAHIFEPFFTTKDIGKGTGLGLAQVHGIVGAHEGYIDVISEPGKGAAFRIYLPALLDEEEALEDLMTLSLTRGRGEGILLVEDEVVTRHALREGLELLNYAVWEAGNGEEALAVYARHVDEIALVLSDVVMPQMGGIAFAEALHTRAPEIPVVFLTGHPLGQADDEDLYRVGDAWLQKPVNLDELSHLLGQLLAGQKVSL